MGSTPGVTRHSFFPALGPVGDNQGKLVLDPPRVPRLLLTQALALDQRPDHVTLAHVEANADHATPLALARTAGALTGGRG